MFDGTVVVVGCGLVGQHYCRNLSAIGVREIVVCDPVSERRRAAAGLVGGKAFASHSEAIDAAQPDVVCVCAPTPAHRAAALAAIRARSAVFLEKPLAVDVAQAEEIVAAAESAGVALGFGLKMRFEAAFSEAHRLVQAGEIGEPTEVVVTYNQNLPPADRLWYLDEGVLLGSMPHAFDLANWWIGGRPERIWADTGRRQGFRGEDRICAVVAYAGGARAVLQMSYQARYPDVATRDDMTFQVVGDSGYLLGRRSGTLECVTRDRRCRMELPRVDGFEAELRAFLSAVAVGASPPVPGAVGLLVQRMIGAAARSTSTGAWASVD